MTRSELDELKDIIRRAKVAEEFCNKLGYTMVESSPNVYEFVKDEDLLPTGDFINPILFVPPMNVMEGLWYYTEEVGKDLPREALTDANAVTDFNNRMVFDWI